MKFLIITNGEQRNYLEEVMIEFKEYVYKIREILRIDDLCFYENLVRFLVDNDWFGIVPIMKNDKMYVDPLEFQRILPKIETYFSLSKLDSQQKAETILDMLKGQVPDTAEKLLIFYQKNSVPEDNQIQITSFLCRYLSKDVCLMSDVEIEEFLRITFNELPKQYGDIITFFLSWTKEHYKTRYMKDYTMLHRIDVGKTNVAYDIDEYLQLLYYLFNDDYIEYNRMYVKAAESKKYIDTWLFLSLHFICSLRKTDLIRIHHPRLTMDPLEVLRKIKEESFSDEDARLTLYSITWRLNVLPLTPNKTSRRANISSIKLCVPESTEVHMGKLFAIAEAHHQLHGGESNSPLIHIISKYEQINRYMGDEIGSLFLESDFKSRAANKSYLQSIFLLSDAVLPDDDFNVKGYTLAALARSHKGSYGEFATTTATYLKDAKFSGFTPEFVARELFERGVLSFVPSMLLKIITDGEYNRLTVSKQTVLIKALDMTPNEIEHVIEFTNKNQKKSIDIMKEILLQTDQNSRRTEIIKILHRIGCGDAVSKQLECDCLMSAMKKTCPYLDRTNCIGCDYEISTKSTIFLLVSEYKRLLSLYCQAKDNKLKEKYKALIKETVLPAMDEILQCIGEQYGAGSMHTLERMIKEATQND